MGRHKKVVKVKLVRFSVREQDRDAFFKWMDESGQQNEKVADAFHNLVQVALNGACACQPGSGYCASRMAAYNEEKQ